MKIKISKSQWQEMGKKAGWMKVAEDVENSEELVSSFQDKMREATNLAFQCAYATISPDGSYLHTKEVDLPEEVWHWADGLAQEYYMKNIEGRTSLQGMIDFDLEKAEQDVDNVISLFRKTLNKVGRPRKLTVEEYRSMGYKS